MHVSFPTALVVSALIASIVLVLNRGDRLWPVVACVAAGIEALMVFNLLQMSVSKFRIDVILPGVVRPGRRASRHGLRIDTLRIWRDHAGRQGERRERSGCNHFQ